MKVKVFLLVTLLSIIFICSVFAYSYLAQDIGYTPSDTSWDVHNTKEALDDLRSDISSYANKRVCTYIDSQYSKDSNDRLSVGTRYECDPGDGVPRRFFILEVNDISVDLLMEKDLDNTGISWYNVKRYFRTGNGSNLGWDNVITVKLPEVQQIVNATDKTGWYYDAADNTSWFCFGLKDKTSCAQGSWTYTTEAGKTAVVPYRWLFNYLKGCTPFGCEFDVSTGQIGYWTSDAIFRNNQFWCVDKYGMINNCTTDSNRSIRPVITILKTNLFY